MRNTLTSFMALIPIAMLTVSSVGCRSLSWKPSKMFSWSSEPEVELPPSPEVPTSPATKYTPNAITSIGGQGSGTSSPTPSAYGYGSPATGYGAGTGVATPSTTAMPSAGLAAKANGYQTGGYQVGVPSSTSSSMGASMTPAQLASKAMPSTPPSASTSKPINPYGGSYGMPSMSASAGSSSKEIPLPQSVTQALQNNKTAPANYPNLQLPGSSMTPVAGSTGLPASGNRYSSGPKLGYPSSALGQLPTATAQTPTASAYTASGGTSSGVSTGGAGATMSLPASMTPATPSATTFSPGSTERETKYNFGTNP